MYLQLYQASKFPFRLLTLCATHIMCDDTTKPNIVYITMNDVGWDDISLHGSDLIYTPNIDTIGIQGIKLQNYYTDSQGTPSASALFTGKYPMKMGTQGPSIRAAEDRGVPTSERLLPSYLKDLGYVTHLVGKWNLGKSRECYLPTNRGFDTFYGSTSDVDYYSLEHLEEINGTTLFGRDFFENITPVRDEPTSMRHLTDILTDRAEKLIEEHDASVPMYLHIAHAAAHIGGGAVPLQATLEDIAANKHIAHHARRLYAGLVTSIDKSVGTIVSALSRRNILNKTIIVIACHNGASSVSPTKSSGPLSNYGSNLPLKGGKGSPWEGAVRSIAMLWHPNIAPNVWNGLFHVTDWVPTIMAMVEGETNKTMTDNLDGVNQWQSIINNDKSKRNWTIITIDDINEWGAFRDGDFKLVIGNVPETCGYYGQELNKIKANVPRPTYEEVLVNSTTANVFNKNLKIEFDMAYALAKRDACNLNKQKAKTNDTDVEIRKSCKPTKVKGCLFNITADPEESQDLWNEYPKIVQQLSVQFRLQWPKLVPRQPVTFDLRADPQNSDYIWRAWVGDDEAMPSTNVSYRFPLDMSEQEFQYFYRMNIDVMSEKLASYMQSMADTLVSSMSSLFGSSTKSIQSH